MIEATLAVRVWRGDANGAFRVYDVPRRPAQTVLDVVTYLQRQVDPSLAYRFACRVGMCGSCAMTVNGRARWTCRTHVDAVVGSGNLEIAPLAQLPVIRDLVVDMAPFFDKWEKARGRFVATATCKDDFARIAPTAPARRAVDAAVECIGCAVCYASCDVVAWNPSYLGPAALNRAWTLPTVRASSGSRPSPAMPVAMRVTPSRVAPSAVPNICRRPHPLPALNA